MVGGRCVSVLVAACMGVSGLVASAAPAGAAAFAVTSAADDGSAGTLRWAVDAANASPGDDVVDIDPQLTGIDLVDCSAGRIEVVANGSLTIAGNDIVVTQTCPSHGVIGGAGTLVVDGVTVTGGTASGDGGGISLGGDLTLTGSTVRFNASTGAGGGIWADRATVVGSQVTDNVSATYGGGIATLGAASVDGSVLRANRAVNRGGAIASTGDLLVVDSVIEANEAANSAGVAGEAAVTVRSSTIPDNDALQFVGGVSGIEVQIVDSTIEGNFAITGPGGLSGEVVEIVGSTVTANTSEYSAAFSARRAEVTRSAIVGNAASKYNGAFTVVDAGTITDSTVAANVGNGPVIDTAYTSTSALTLDHATIVGNTGGSGIMLHGPFRSYGSVVALNGTADCVLGAGSGEIHSDGYSVSGDTSCGFNHPSDLTGVGDPGLDTLALHDGPTLNLVPQSGSPLLNRIPASDPRCTGTDQRGYARPANGGCDVGAVEVRAVAAAGTEVATSPGTPVRVDLVPLVTDPDAVLATYEVEGAASGTLDAAAGGLVTYTPANGFSGTDWFTFVVCSEGDVICTSPATVSVAVADGPEPARPVEVAPRFTG